MELSLNTVESYLAMQHVEKRAELSLAALQALDYVRKHRLDEAVIRPIVTHYEKSVNIRGKSYTKVHTKDRAVWEIGPTGAECFLCSDGNVYQKRSDLNFWNQKVQNLMPIEPMSLDTYSDFMKYLNEIDIPHGITGMGWYIK
jgi:hypothetical protein